MIKNSCLSVSATQHKGWGRFVVLAAVFLAVNCSSGDVRDDAKFSYQNIYEDRYQRGNGGIIPITIERGESYSGTITNDQRYLYFSSNTAGNYDLYLRDLTDVFSVPVVSTVTNQKEPAISPNGKYLVYVDDELDPDGDIVLLKVNPKKLIELYRERKQPDEEWFASKAKNLTNSESNRVRARDSNPVWSPDGEWIAWSTDLDPKKADDLGAGAGALQNIWIMPAFSPEQKRQVTTRGGVMPAFSPDGKRIAYISYEDDNSSGAVYEVEIATGKTRRLTSGHALDFYPTYTPDGEGVVLTRIAADSNGDGQIDRKDAGQIIRIYPDQTAFTLPEKHTGQDLAASTLDDDDFVPLTSPSDHVFDSRVSNFVGGSVVLAQLRGEDINVAFIPLSGAIPVKPDIRQQQDYLLGLQKRSRNQARVCMALEELPAAFATSPDIVIYDAISAMRRARCDKQAAQDLREYLASITGAEQNLYRLLSDLAGLDSDLTDLQGVADLEPLAEPKNADAYYASVLRQKNLWSFYYDEDDETDFKAITAFIRHTQAKGLIRQGRHKEAAAVIGAIIRENPTYLGIDELLLANGMLDSATLPANELAYLISNEPDASILGSYKIRDKKYRAPVRGFVRRDAEKFLLKFFEAQFDAGNESAQEQFIQAFPEKQNRALHALFALASARDNAYNDLYTEAEADAAKVHRLTEPGSLYHYYATLVVAGNAELNKGADAAIALYTAAITGYRDDEAPENVRAIVEKIGIFYRDKANLMRTAGDDRGATKQYEALLDLYLSAHGNRLTRQIQGRDLLEYTLNLDQIALRSATNDPDLLEGILNFYDSRIDLARRFLVTEFIFGRGFLRAQLGIQHHLAAESSGLSRSEKKQVFEYFRKAEIDLNWCFFANARFADAYIMLGWMYQFIDEKREVVLDTTSGKRDREVFESLYKEYFPDYLFEKNIRIYQKTLTLFGKSGSPRVRNSFHLNIANNYFLLNNYSQAEEHYTAILDAKGLPDYQFETPEQEMMYYYHLGRTLYFTGKYDAAARYLRYVENNLNARYPLAGVSAEDQKLNQQRRERAYKTFALNSEYSQNLASSINYLQTIVAERQAVVAETPGSMVHLELARLYLHSGDLSSSLEQTQKAEALLSKEDEIPVPRYKIRIKWFWIYEPWTWLVGLIYKLPYDDVVIGENHLAFELPTVNRYQLLYSIRADIYRNKGLLQEASQSLAKLVEYAEKDKTKHGAETRSNAVSRRAELEFSLRSWDSARKLYTDALEQAEKNKNNGAALMFRKNIELCRLRKLETEMEPAADKIRKAREYADEIQAFEDDAVKDRVSAARKVIKDREDPAKPDLTDTDIQKIRENTQAELQPVLFFRGLYLAHVAELTDFAGRFASKVESFDDYLNRKQASYSGFTGALKFFRGYTNDSYGAVYPAFEPDLKNNSLRMKLAMNRAKILQEMSLFDESVAEFRSIQERSQEFNAQLEYAIASYRLYRVYEDAEKEGTLSSASYESLVRYFVEHTAFLRQNTDLFERLCNILIDRSLRSRNYAEAMRLEDLKRQAGAVLMYFDDLRLAGQKEELFGKLLSAEQRRYVLAERIRAARLQRSSPQQLEKELSQLDAQVRVLRENLSKPDKTDYDYRSLFMTGYSENEIAALAKDGLVYVLKPRDDLMFLYARATPGRRSNQWTYRVGEVPPGEAVADYLKKFLSETKASVLVVGPQILPELQADHDLGKISIQTSLRAAINFAKNPDLARRNTLQIVKVTSFFSFGGKNEVDYQNLPPVERVRNSREAQEKGIHRNVVDYEAELARKAIVIDNALMTPAALFTLRNSPNFAVVSFQSRDPLQKADEFRFATAADLYFSSMGVGQVLHTFNSRSAARPVIEQFLSSGTVAAGALATGNAHPGGFSAALKLHSSQLASYERRIAQARKRRDYAEALSYAEDALSLYPAEVSLRLVAAELNDILGDKPAAVRHLSAADPEKQTTIQQKLSYFRVMARVLDDTAQRAFLAQNTDLVRFINRDIAEFSALRQLQAYTSGNLDKLSQAAPWESATVSTDRLRVPAIDGKVRNEELRNEICVAATGALEFALVINSCTRNANADADETAERNRVRTWFTDYKPDLKVIVRNEDLELNHAVALLQSGYVSDALPYARKTLAERNLSVSENLMAFSLLRVLASRKVADAESGAIARMLENYGDAALGRASNLQAKQFYALLGAAGKVYSKGAAAIPQTDQKSLSSGVRSARNLLVLLAMSVNPAEALVAKVQGSGLAFDRPVENDLQFMHRAIAGGAAQTNCGRENCSLLIKYYLTKKQTTAAMDLILRQQGAGRSWENLTRLPAGTYGFAELFAGETYEWSFDGKDFDFDRIDEFTEKTAARVRSGRRYLAWPPQKNLFARKNIDPPRDAILVSLSTLREIPAPVPEGFYLDAPQPATLYSILFARWGHGRAATGKAQVIQVKPAGDDSPAQLSIYDAPLQLESLGQLRPGGYHLVCAEGEAYNGFAVFAQAVVEAMVKQNMPPEQAYAAATKSLKGRQAANRPLYYLYRN